MHVMDQIGLLFKGFIPFRPTSNGSLYKSTMTRIFYKVYCNEKRKQLTFRGEKHILPIIEMFKVNMQNTATIIASLMEF